MGGEVIIRSMTREDVSRVHEIDCLSFALPWSERSYLFEINENGAARLWVAEILGEDNRPSVVGMLVIWLILDEAHVGTIAVHPDFRNRGIARRLLAKGLLNALEGGARHSLLEVRRSNVAAQQLYRRFGYEVVGVRPRYYRDNGEDALLMNLDVLDADGLRAMIKE